MIRAVFEIPSTMRAAYADNALDHFFKKGRCLRRLERFFPEKKAVEVKQALQESLESPGLKEILAKQGQINGALNQWKLVFLRSVVRLARPDCMLETGVAHGSSSAVILEAMERNQKGRLFSIDLPILSGSGELKSWLQGYEFRPEDISTVADVQQVGWLVPPELRARWSLTLGDALAEMPPLLARLGAIDIFLHDSLHLYDHMMKEFDLAWPCLKKGGILLADDIFLKRHAVIHDFSKKQRVPFSSYFQMGAMRKS